MEKRKKRQWQFTLLYLLVAAVAVYIFQSQVASSRPSEVSYSEFISELRAGRLAEVSVSESKLVGKLKKDATKTDGGDDVDISHPPAQYR